MLLIGLDAAEPRLIERWMADGSLPNLRRLRESGSYGRLASTADWISASPWPTFYTGTSPGDHGYYRYLAWRADEMRTVRPSPDWLPLTPFWRRFGADGPRAVAVDVPLTYAPEPFNGVELCGWASHDRMTGPCSLPGEVLEWVDREFGSSPRTEEEYGLLPLRGLLRERDAQCRLTDLLSQVAERLVRRETWDLFVVAFGATHRGGHKLWDETGVVGRLDPRGREEMGDALRQVYITCDRAVGWLLEAAGGGVTTLVFSLHGMGPNTSRSHLLPQMLDRILADGAPARSATRPRSITARFRDAVPPGWRTALKRRLPLPIQDRLSVHRLVSEVDWAATPAFCLPGDLQGYIRLNRAGRETKGILTAEAAAALCTRVAEGLRTFREADGQDPVVTDVTRSDSLYPQGRRTHLLPDLLVRWSERPVAGERAIVSSRLDGGVIPGLGSAPGGRSGNHRPEGFLIVAGPGVTAAGRLDGHILDLAPTVHALLGVDVPAEMRGRSLLSAELTPNPM